MRRLLILPVLLLTLLVGNPAFSADWDKGYAAYRSDDYATALREWKPLAEQGDARAQYWIGRLYDEGDWEHQKGTKSAIWKGLPQNYGTAVKWFRLAAEQGYAKAQSSLGYKYEEGQGVPKDCVTAMKWHKLASKQGDGWSSFSVGQMYGKGNCVGLDYETALKWYRLAAEQGDKYLHHRLGYMFEVGDNIRQDYKSAVKWYRRAAEQGVATSLMFLDRLKIKLVEKSLDDCLYDEIDKIRDAHTRQIVTVKCRKRLNKRSIDWLIRNID